MIVDRVIDEFFAEKSAAVFFNDGGLLLMKEGCDIVRVSVKAGNIVLDSHHGESRGKIGPIGLKPAKELLFALFFYDKTWRVVQCEWLQGEEDSNFEELHVFTDAKSSCIVCEDSAGHSYEFKAEYDSYSRDSVLGKKLGCLVPISKRDCDAKLLISPMQAATIAWRAWCNEKEKFQKSSCSLNNGDEDEWLYRHVADSEQSFWSDYGDDLGPECNWPD